MISLEVQVSPLSYEEIMAGMWKVYRSVTRALEFHTRGKIARVSSESFVRDSHERETVSPTYRGRQRKSLCKIFMRPCKGERKKKKKKLCDPIGSTGVICKKDEVGRVAFGVVKSTRVSRCCRPIAILSPRRTCPTSFALNRRRFIAG